MKEVFIMSKYYARFEETRAEVFAFPTEQERNQWVNYQDEYSRTFGVNSEDNFKRIAITSEQAEEIIERFALIKVQPDEMDEFYFGSNKVKIYY